VTDALGRQTQMTYDNLNRVLTTTDPANATTTYVYDENGNTISVTDALNRQWTFTYDKKDRQDTMKDPPPLNRVTRMQYDAADQLIGVISPSGRTMRYTYDERGQRKTIADGLGGIATFGYDNRGTLAALSDQRGNTTTFAYDELFRLTGQRDPLGRLMTLEYDVVNNVTAGTDRMGRRTTINRDALNRPQSVAYVDATVNYSYDAAGRWTQISDASGMITWQYDNANRTTAEITSLGTVSYGYNNANQRTSMTAADRQPVAYGYDAAGRLQTIAQGAETFTYGYDTLSQRTSFARPNGVTTSYQYDEVNRLKRLTHTNASSATLEDLQYEFNLDDEINKITSLASAPLTPQSKTVTVADVANRIGQFGVANIGFNAEGQTTSKTDTSGTVAYQWDARGRLTQATLPNSQVVSYGYDALGRRANRAANNVTTTFQYDGADVVIDRESGGSAYDYLNGLDIDEKLRQSGGAFGTLYFLQDHLSSTAALANTSGVLVEQQQYEAFGANAGSVRTRYQYTGRERDEMTGLMYNRARWFDPSQGRFLSEDPIGLSDGLNFYTYVENAPLGYTDPLGLSKKKLHDDLSNLCNNCDTIDRDVERVRESYRRRQEEIRRLRDTGQKVNPGHYKRLNMDKLKLERCEKKQNECNKRKRENCPELERNPAPNPAPKRNRDFLTDPPFVPIPPPLPRPPVIRPVPAMGSGFIFIISPCIILPSLCPRPEMIG
ncbi:MAG: RHS repeat-associated core domain-containing protein, partial [Candidatus Binatia bacterium]